MRSHSVLLMPRAFFTVGLNGKAEAIYNNNPARALQQVESGMKYR